MSTALERYPGTGIEQVDRRARALLAGSLDIGHFRQHPEDLATAFFALLDLGLEPGPLNLRDMYVIGGRVEFGYHAQLDLLHRAGGDLRYSEDECGPTEATIEIRSPGGTDWHRVTVTYQECEDAGWVKRNPSYRTMPARMVFARAVTKALGTYAPEVTRRMVHAADAAAESSGAGSALGEVGGPASDLNPAPDNHHPLAFAPDGASIPASQREHEADPAERDDLAAILAADPALAEIVRARAHDIDENFPNVRSRRFTRVHLALVEYLIAEARLELRGEGWAPGQPPDDAYDLDEPDSEPGTERYDPTDLDPGRPL